MKKLTLAYLCFLWAFALQAQRNPPKVCYEIFVRSFADSNGDGIGDLNGITAKLDYLQDLGVEAIWLTPICKSPSYHKYDVTDYYQIDPEYGTLADYKRLISEAHKRGILVIKDLVINHTSSQHPWFLEAQKGKDNPYRNYYVWMTPQKIEAMGVATREAAGGSWELTPWHYAHNGDSEKYYGLFTGMMPDLNYDNPQVRQEIYKIGRYWLKEVGVDGFRMDAAKHIYPEWEAPKCHAFWEEFQREMKAVKPHVYVIGEIWAKATIVAPYFKGIAANFNFDASHAIQNIVKSGKDEGLVKNMLINYTEYAKQNPAFIDATLLSNHDGTRIATIAEGNPYKLKMAANLLLTLPGEPYLYYGEEIGMLGDKPDEHIREPFLWDTQPRDSHRTTWLKPRYNTETTIQPLSAQQADPNSLFNHYKKLIRLRRSLPALSQVIQPNLTLLPSSASVIAFVRTHAAGNVLVVHNLSNAPQTFRTPQKNYTRTIFKTQPDGFVYKNGTWTLPPYSMLLLKP